MEKMHAVKPETYPSISETKKVKYYPTFRLDTDDMPELKDMEVGKRYKLEMEVEMMSKMEGDEWNQNAEKKPMKCTMKVMKVGCEDMQKKATTKGKDFEMDYAKRRSGGTGSRYDKN